jgi:hypothetical protein
MFAAHFGQHMQRSCFYTFSFLKVEAPVAKVKRIYISCDIITGQCRLLIVFAVKRAKKEPMGFDKKSHGLLF